MNSKICIGKLPQSVDLQFRQFLTIPPSKTFTFPSDAASKMVFTGRSLFGHLRLNLGIKKEKNKISMDPKRMLIFIKLRAFFDCRTEVPCDSRTFEIKYCFYLTFSHLALPRGIEPLFQG